MGQLIFFIKKHYFYTNLAAAATFSMASANLVSNVVETNLDAGVVASPIAGRVQKKSTPRVMTTQETYAGLLTGNLLRDSESATVTDEAVNPTEIILIGTVAADWKNSMATIQLKSEKVTKEYPAGAKIGEYRIAWIARNKIIVKNPAGERFTIEVGQENDPAAKGSKKGKSSSKAGGVVRKVLSRDKVNRLLASPKDLMKGFALAPKLKGNKMVGYAIKRIRSKHFFYQIGARRGDIISRVNGQPLDKMEKMMSIYEELKTAPKLVIDIDRKGTPTTFELIIKN